jgi:hypothetical protein
MFFVYHYSLANFFRQRARHSPRAFKKMNQLQ